jgi:hypothetical protein
MKAYPAGAFLSAPPNMPHYAWAQGWRGDPSNNGRRPHGRDTVPATIIRPRSGCWSAAPARSWSISFQKVPRTPDRWYPLMQFHSASLIPPAEFSFKLELRGNRFLPSLAWTLSSIFLQHNRPRADHFDVAAGALAIQGYNVQEINAVRPSVVRPSPSARFRAFSEHRRKGLTSPLAERNWQVGRACAPLRRPPSG